MKTKNLHLRRHTALKVILTLIFLGLPSFFLIKTASMAHETSAASFTGTKVVLVRYKNIDSVSSSSSQSTKEERRQDIAAMSDAVDSALEEQPGRAKLLYTYKSFPFAAFEVDSAGEAALKSNPNIAGVVDNIRLKKFASLSDPITAMDGSPTLGFSDGTNNYNGTGYAVAILDDGVDKSHPALAGKIIEEICIGYTSPITFLDGSTAEGACPSGVPVISDDGIDIYQGSGVASNCSALAALGGCSHGTSVAAAATMSTSPLSIPPSDTVTTSGSAAGAKVIAVQINSKFTDDLGEISLDPDLVLSMIAFDIIGFNYDIFDLPIASINFSNGGGEYASSYAACAAGNSDLYDYYHEIFTDLRSIQIAPVISNGNEGADLGFDNKIAFPACVEGAVAVVATNTTGTAISSYSNNAPITSLLAPGGDYSPLDNGSLIWLPEAGTTLYKGVEGTSFAAPLAAGAFAVMRQKYPAYSVDQILSRLQSTGKPITDGRPGYTVGSKPLIQLSAALAGEIIVVTPVTISGLVYPTEELEPDEPFTLEATITGATTCTISGGIGAITIPEDPYDLSITLPARSSYTITCTNTTGGTSTRTINLNILGGGISGRDLDVPNTGAGKFSADNTSSSTFNTSLAILVIISIAAPALLITRRTIKKKIHLSK